MMRQLFLILLLSIFSVNALAELSFVTADEVKSVYADTASIVQTNNLVAMSGVFDFKIIHTSNTNQTYQSLTFRDEYDCDKKQKRNLAITIYPKNMGEGEMLISYDDVSKWQEISGVSEMLWKVACKIQQ